MKLLRSYRLLLVALLVVLIPALRAQAPAITSPGNATAQIAVPFAYTINATGNPTSYSIVSTAPSSLIQGVYRGAFGSQTTASGKIWMAGSGQEFPNGPAFAAITSNGSAVAWGNPDAGGNATAVSSSLSSNITAIYSNSQAFAALKSNGSVVTWGDPERGGNSTSRVGGNLTSGVTAIFSNANAFAALKSNGSVVTWGDPTSGGNATIYEFGADGSEDVEFSVASRLTSSVVSIAASRTAFAARTTSGSVVSWGDSEWGGNSTSLASSLSSNVTAVFSNYYAFAALRSDGSVVTWGYDMQGGDSSYVSANLTSGVTAIFSNANAFAALKSNGSVVTWGDFTSGGDSSSPTGGNLASEVKSIASTRSAFAALKNDGSVVTWGLDHLGGDSTIFTPVANFENPPIVTSVADLLTSNVTAIYATEFAFAALKNNGSVVTWGYADLGGDSSSVSASLSSNVTAIAANFGAFAALKRDGSIVAWGSSAPGDIPAPANIGAPAADITSLTGLSFNSANGSLTGSPTKSGNFSLRIGATNSTGTGTAPFSLLILGAPGMSLSGDLTFGPVFVGQNATRNFSIANPASGPLTVSSIASSNSSFTLTGSTNFTVSPGFSQNVTVRFQPAAPGNFTASITVASNAGNNSLTAAGSGVPAASPITITGNLSFGNVTVNQTANSTLSIKNNASNIVTMSVAVPSWLTANATGNFTLAGNATRNVTVTFRPTSEGNFTGNITATSSVGNAIISASGAGVHTRIIGLSGNLSFGSLGVNATATRNLTITNTGTGNLTITGISSSNASFSLTGNTTNLVVGRGGNRTVSVVFQPSSAGNFTGTITVNSTATSGNSTIAASGTGVFVPVITSNLSASGAVGGNFSYQITASNNPTSFGNASALPAGLSLNATTGLISGKPTAAGNSTVTLRATNAGGTGTANLTVAISPSRVISLSGNFAFGNATVNSTLTRNLTITNSGTGNLTITGISYPQGFSGNWNGTIAPNSTRNVTVSFRPTSEGPLTGTITVNSTATSGNNTISASGTGIHSRIIGLSGDLAFGSALANRTLEKTPTRTLTISNSGTGNLTITRIERPAGFRVFASLPDPSLGGNYTTVNFTSSGFSVSLAELTGNFTLPIAAGTSKSLLVAFLPTAAAIYSGNITVASNASNAASNSTRAASGTGVTSPLSITGNLSFGNVTVNQQAQRTLSITNLDSESHALSFAIGAGYSVAFSPSPYNMMGNPVTLQAGATVNATVTFSPFSVQGYSGNLSITSASAGNKTIPATGTATHSRVIGLSGNLSFGNATVNSTITRNLTITNTGTGPLSVSGISYPPGFSGNWSAGTINATATRNVTVLFRPTSEGPFNGTITVTSNATSGPSTIAASGTGLHARIMLLSGNLSFGTLTVNQTANRTLSIRNTGTGPLSVTGISYPAGFSGNWSSGTIPPNSTQNVTITFRPLEEQLYGGNITINSTATSGPSTIAASGTGFHSRVIGLSGNLSFGGLTITQTANRTLSISNTGTGSLSVSGISLPDGFSGNWSGTIAPKTTQNVIITFSPLVEKIYTGNITISSTATSGVSTIAASGSGTPTRIIGLTGNLSFGGQTVNQTATSTLSIRNTGTGPLNVTGINYPTGFSGNWSSGTIPPNATQNVTVSFRPTSEGNFTGNITVNSTATSGPTTIAASGTGLHSRIMGLTGNLSFGTLTVNQTANRTLSIRNTGTGPLSITGINYPTGFSGNWSSGTINPNTTQNLTITFRPLADQAYTGNITINSTATSGVSAIAASGSGAHSRIIGLTGNLSFGNLTVYRAANRTLSISNTGTGNLTVNSISFTAGFSGNWSGTIAPGATQNVTVLFAPTVAQTNPMVGQSYSGNATVVSDATIGSGVRAVSGVAVVPVTAMVAVSGGALPSTTVSTFQIGKYEVTWDEWKAVRGWAVANGYTDLANAGDVQGATTSAEKNSYGTFPVDNVTWFDVVKWCNAKSEMEKLTPVYQVNGATYKTGNEATVSLRSNATGYRLPSEPEWEWAARGGNSTKGFTYSGNNTADVVAWYQSNSGGVTKSVGTKKSNELGIFDMSGNVWEWCWDEVEPARPIRGGSAVEGQSAAVVTYRPSGMSPTDRSNIVGFRLVRGSGVIAPAISQPGRTDGQVGFPYTYQIQAKNKPTSYGATPLPAGLSINATTGLISGTPTVAGLFTANLTASNAGGTNKNYMLFHIAPPMNQIITLPSSILFGNRKLNEAATLKLNISNPRSESLNIQLISYPSGSVFSGELYPITLGAGSNKNFNVNFTPTQATSYTGNITVQFSTNLNNIPRVFWVNIPVSGSGIP